AAVELAKDWRSDRVLRRLEALLVVADKEHGYVISGSGELIEPDDGILAIGSGGNYALAAARALAKSSGLAAKDIVQRSLEGAAFLKVEASKFTEVGYVGRDVESMVRELVDVAINMVRTEREDEVYPEAEARAEERLLDILLPPVPPSPLPPLASRPGEGS